MRKKGCVSVMYSCAPYTASSTGTEDEQQQSMQIDRTLNTVQTHFCHQKFIAGNDPYLSSLSLLLFIIIMLSEIAFVFVATYFYSINLSNDDYGFYNMKKCLTITTLLFVYIL